MQWNVGSSAADVAVLVSILSVYVRDETTLADAKASFEPPVGGVFVGVRVGVDDPVGVAVGVRVGVEVLVGEESGVTVGVRLGVEVLVSDEVGITVGVRLGVAVLVAVGVFVGLMGFTVTQEVSSPTREVV